VEVGTKRGGGQSDVVYHYGIDHYYEMEVFTDDSQNYPLVFCVSRLPANLPTTGTIDVPVRVAGFFFKDWLYTTRRAAAAHEESNRGGHPQYAPLLIGAEPQVLATPQPGKRGIGQFVGGVLFVLALAAIWGVAVWYARGDRKFRKSVLAPRFSLPPGESLNDLNLPATDEPMTTKVDSPPSSVLAD
jgi:hypothetical protein